MIRRLTSLLVCCCLCWIAAAQTPIGTWRTHHAYNQLYRLAEGGSRIYAAGKMGVMYYDRSRGETGTLTRVDGLSEAGIADIAYDSVSRCLVVAYNSSNVDLVQDGHVYNLSDIRRADIDGSKTIHNIRFHAGRAWLCCDFGVVLVDLLRREVASTLYLGGNGNRTAVYDIAFSSDKITAATSQGLMQIALDDPYPNIASRWQCDSTLVDRGETATMLAIFDNSLYVLAQTFVPDSLTLYRHTAANSYTPIDSGLIQTIRATHTQMTVCKWNSIVVHTAGQAVADTLRDGDYWTALANHDACLSDSHTVWVVHDYEGLIAIDMNEAGYMMRYLPNTPFNYENVYRLHADKNRVLLSPGGKRTTYENTYNPAQICYLQQEQWRRIQDAALDTIADIVDAVTDPTDASHIVAASWGKGVIDIRNGQVTAVFNEANTNGALQPYTSGTYRSLRTGGVAFDRQGNLWVSNSLSRYGLACRKTDGSWTGYDTYNMVGSHELDQVICDSVRGYLWFYGKDNILFVHDGGSRMAYVDPNNGSKKTTSSLNCVVQDRSGDLWLGTNGGIKVIYDAYRAFNGGGHGEKSPVTCSNIIIDNGEFVEYLMAYENITCMAVDGANRKWVGTATGGLYLISATGQKELQHFTTQNSPLLSNKILSLAIHPQSGEVFIGTDCGLISYRSTATYATATPSDDIHAYPNPVEPDYEGPIAIKGFTRDALVHITDAAGHVVYSTRALGGQAIWYGRTNNGGRVASGVYYVFASDEEHGNRSVTKILVIR